MCAQHGRSLTGESPEHASSRKCIARGKGVRREAESEGSPRQTSDLTDRNYIRRNLRIRLHHKLKSNSYNISGWRKCGRYMEGKTAFLPGEISRTGKLG